MALSSHWIPFCSFQSILLPFVVVFWFLRDMSHLRTVSALNTGYFSVNHISLRTLRNKGTTPTPTNRYRSTAFGSIGSSKSEAPHSFGIFSPVSLSFASRHHHHYDHHHHHHQHHGNHHHRLFSSSSSEPELQPQPVNQMKLSISDAFDGGNIQHIETIQQTEESESTTVLLKIKPDPYTEFEQTNHFQYFSFRATVSPEFNTNNTPENDDTKETQVTYKIINAGEASYAIAWKGATTCYSTDRKHWRRVLNTSFDPESGHLTWTFPHLPSQQVHFAYFPPYSHERHLDLIAKCTASAKATVYSLGQSLDGREMECVQVGTGPKKVWIIHRQHPGESMAEFYAEGLLERLLGLDSATECVDGLTQKATELFTFYIVPNMCPDGSVRGHLRTNAIGSNLNREWAPSSIPANEATSTPETPYDAPTLERSPEVYHVLNAMDQTGVDAFLDVHGDEELPYNFLAGAEGCPNWGDRLKYLQGAFLASYCRANSDMQIPIGYECEEPGKGRMNVCSNQISYRFDCLGVTLEMPFKDCWSHSNPETGWSPDRAKMLGKSVLDALVYVEPYLRAEGEFWKDGSEKWEGEDKYVAPTSKYE